MDLNSFTQKSQQAILAARELAAAAHQQQVDPLHLAVALLSQPDTIVFPVLSGIGADPMSVRRALEGALESRPSVYGDSGEVVFSPEAVAVLEAAEARMRQLKDRYVSVEHILLGLAGSPGEAGKALRDAGITEDAVLEALATARGSQRVTSENPEDTLAPLENFGRDLVQLAARGKLDPVIGRDDEIRRVIQVLSRRTKNNPVLIGEPGVGKTAIAEGLAQRIVDGDVPEGLKNKRHGSPRSLAPWSPAPSTAASSKSDSRPPSTRSRPPRASIITFIDEMHTIVGAGAAEGAMDASNMLKPMLARGELRMVGATTLDEFRKHIEKDAGSGTALPAGAGRTLPGSTTPSESCAGSRSATRCTTGCGSPTPPWSPPPSSPIVISPGATCRTKQSTSIDEAASQAAHRDRLDAGRDRRAGSAASRQLEIERQCARRRRPTTPQRSAWRSIDRGRPGQPK